MAKVNGFTTEWMLKNGFTKNLKGEWLRASGPAVANTADITDPYSLLIPKAKVNDSPDFTHRVITEWFIPYQVPSKKNSRQVFVGKNGKMMNIPSKSYSTYVAVTKKYWEVFGLEFNQTFKKLELKYPLNIEMTFIRKTQQLVDFFGPGESVFDLMTDFHWWPDDNRRFGKPFFGDMEVDKNNPGVRIKILL